MCVILLNKNKKTKPSLPLSFSMIYGGHSEDAGTQRHPASFSQRNDLEAGTTPEPFLSNINVPGSQYEVDLSM